jgi:16S rRNA (guanine527-N7)-methyltransferase
LERAHSWLSAVLATPGLTAIRGMDEARAMLLDDALRALPLLRAHGGDVIDVGSGGGSPGIPLALELPERAFTLVEAERRKADFLRAHAPANVEVVRGRAEEQGVDRYGVALAKALARPATAVEWVLPLVAPGGIAIFWLGPSAELDVVGRVAARVGGGDPELRDGLVVVPKLERTPAGFPRRVGVAKKRPLG